MSVDTSSDQELVQSSPEESASSALEHWIRGSREGAKRIMNNHPSISFRVPAYVETEIKTSYVVIDSTGVRHPANYTQVYCDRETLERWLKNADI